MITVSTLFSGSSGNSTLVRTEKTAVLVDAGRNCKAVSLSLQSLDMELSDISAVFVTHEHSDHISALEVMSKRHPVDIHVTEPSARELCRGHAAAENAVIHRGLTFEEQIGDLHIRSFPLPHDSMAHVGYVITSDDGDSIGIATDLGYASDETVENLSRCKKVVVESNHDVQMLKNGIYPYYLKQRILSKFGHLSNDGSAELCAKLAAFGCEAFMLAHLSSENNTPDLALCAVRSSLNEHGFSNLTVKVAPKDCAKTL